MMSYYRSSDNYTQAVQALFSFNGKTLDALFDQKTNESGLPYEYDLLSPDDFQSGLDRVRYQYTCSGRRFLMDWIHGQKETEHREDGGFSYTFENKTYEFHGLGMDYAVVLPDKELQDYVYLIRELASANDCNDTPASEEVNTKENRSFWLKIVKRAMAANAQDLLSHEEIVMLGHALHFSLDQIRQFSFRSLQDDGFSINRADDLIDIYCFSSPDRNSRYHARRLKALYRTMTEGVEKVRMDEKNRDQQFTEAVHQQFRSEEQIRNRFANDEEFMEWMTANAPYLDLPSKTACDIFRKLTHFSCELLAMHGDGRGVTAGFTADDRMESESMDRFRESEYDIYFKDAIEDHVLSDTELPDGIIWEEEAEQIQEYLFRNYNFTFSYFDGSTEDESLDYGKKKLEINVQNKKILWGVPVVAKDKRTARDVLGGQRLLDLLKGNTAVEKPDLMMMLWFVCNLFWEWADYGEKEEFADRIDEFIDLSNELLERCYLPMFYAPHIMEYCMLSAMVAAHETDYEAGILNYYEWFCESLK